MELETGMYVRTEYGISKIVNIFFGKTGTFIATDNGLGNCTMSIRGELHKGVYILEEDYKTFIDNNVKSIIIDLIEIGDYINGCEILHIEDKTLYAEYSFEFDDYMAHFNNEDIKSIVTKEQFEAIAYKVGD